MDPNSLLLNSKHSVKKYHIQHITSSPYWPKGNGKADLKSGPWLYVLITVVPAPRSYIIETPTGLNRRNRMHLSLAAPLHPEALIPRSWVKQLSRKTPPPAANTPEQPEPVLPSATLEGSKENTLVKPTQPSPTDTPSALMPTSPANVLQGTLNVQPLKQLCHTLGLDPIPHYRRRKEL